MKKPFFLLLLLFFCINSFALHIEKSESKFFPKELGEKLLLFKSFETFWWGFVITDVEHGHKVCSQLKKSKLFQRVECEQSAEDYHRLVSDWAKDLPVRHAPPLHLREKFLQALSKASLPMPADLFSVLRVDPLESYEDLLAIFKSRLNLPFERVEGMFVDQETKRVIIPVQPSFGPGESEKLVPLKLELADKAHFLGPHASTLENKAQITVDLKWVSLLGAGVTLFYVLLFLYLRQLRLSLLLLPAFIGAALSAWTIDLLFGGIHGLTMCFGAGLIGLAVDFGLHAAFHPGSKQVWKSNASAFITTLLCLVVIAFSKIPLLRELMYFSTLGFVYAYLIYYFFRKQISRYLVGRECNVSLQGSKKSIGVSITLTFGLFIGLFTVRPSFDFKQFDFQGAKTRELSTWLYPKTIKMPPLFQVTHGEMDAALAESKQQLQWAKENKISLDTTALYLPDRTEREKHVSEWNKVLCGNKAISISKEERVLFGPLLDNWKCDTLTEKASISTAPEYIRPLSHGSDYLTLWLPQTKTEEAAIRSRFPSAQPLGELTTSFSKILSDEVLWMLPLSLLLIVGYLLLYYRNLFLAFCGIVPFLIGCGAIAWAAILFKLPLSFMTLMSVIMLLGLSVDYGVFAVDALWFSQSETEVKRTATAMLLSSVTTVLGFIPLLGCKHQVLFQLGASLTLGILGTLVGTYYTVPSILKSRLKK